MLVEVPAWLESPSIPRLDGFQIVWDVDLDEPQKGVDALAAAIAREHAKRSRLRAAMREREDKLAKAENRLASKRLSMPVALKWTKPACYHAILACLHWEVFDCLEARAEGHGRLQRGPRVERSFFMTGLVGIFAHVLPKASRGNRQARDKGTRAVFADEKERARMAKDMWWAFRHYVEPAELVAFWRQYRRQLDRLTPYTDALLPQMTDQVIERRALFQCLGSDLEDLRGRYPDSINAEVERRVQFLEEQRGPARRELDEDWDEDFATARPGSDEDDEDWL